MGKKLIIALGLVVCALCFIKPTGVSAHPNHPYSGGAYVSFEQYCEDNCDVMLDETLLGHILDAYEPNEDLIEMLKFNVDTTGGKTNDFAIINSTGGKGRSVYKFFCIIGILLTVAYFIIELNKTMLVQGGDFTIKTFYAPFMKFAIGIIMILILGDLIIYFAGFNNAIVEEFRDINVASGGTGAEVVWSTTEDSFSSVPDGWTGDKYRFLKMDSSGNFQGVDELATQIKEMSLFSRLAGVCNTLLIGLGAAVASLVMMYQAISRKLEMILRTVFFPLSAGDIFEGSHSGMIKYYKKMLALALSGLGMIMIIAIGTSLQMSMMGAGVQFTSLKSLLSLILVPLAEAGMCATVKTVCNDALGV